MPFFNKGFFTTKDAFDNTNIRILIATLLSLFRLAFASVLLFIFGSDLFKEIFSDISILSLIAIALFGLPISVKEEMLKNSYSKITTNFYYGIFKILILIAMLSFITYSSLSKIAILIFGVRLYFLLLETQQEINGKKYALVNQFYAELIIVFTTILFYYQIEIVSLLLIFLILLESLYLFYIHIKKQITYINISNLFQLKAWLLEISSILIFGLNIFWASQFMTEIYFAIYFFSYRVASNLTIIWGVATKNIWAQLYKSEKNESEKYLKSSEETSIKIISVGIIFLVSILILYQFDTHYIYSGSQSLNLFIISLCVYCITFLVLQIQNRNIKNRVSAKGQIYNLYRSNLSIGILLTLLLAVGLNSEFEGDYVFLIYFSVNIISLMLLNMLQKKLVH